MSVFACLISDTRRLSRAWCGDRGGPPVTHVFLSVLCEEATCSGAPFSTGGQRPSAGVRAQHCGGPPREGAALCARTDGFRLRGPGALFTPRGERGANTAFRAKSRGGQHVPPGAQHLYKPPSAGTGVQRTPSMRGLDPQILIVSDSSNRHSSLLGWQAEIRH